MPKLAEAKPKLHAEICGWVLGNGISTTTAIIKIWRFVKMNSTNYNYICKRCKNTVNQNDKYCNNCGADLKENLSERPSENDSKIDFNNYKEEINILKADEKTIEVLPPKVLIITRIIFIIYLVFIGAIFQLVNLTNQQIGDYFFLNFLPSAIGSGLGFGIVPGIIALVRKSKNKKPTKSAYINYYITSTALLLLTFVPRLTHLVR